MKGMVLAGGTGFRLSPLTVVANKHLLPVSNYPTVFHPIARLKQTGVTEILIVTGRAHMGDGIEPDHPCLYHQSGNRASV